MANTTLRNQLIRLAHDPEHGSAERTALLQVLAQDRHAYDRGLTAATDHMLQASERLTDYLGTLRKGTSEYRAVEKASDKLWEAIDALT